MAAAAAAIARCCGESILASTPPVLFPAASRVGESPASCAAATCSPPNSEFDAVTEPVIATPSQPINGEISAKALPAPAAHSPIVTVCPERFITYASASTVVIVRIVERKRTSVAPYARSATRGRMRRSEHREQPTQQELRPRRGEPVEREGARRWLAATRTRHFETRPVERLGSIGEEAFERVELREREDHDRIR